MSISEFVHLKRVYGTSLDEARKLVVIEKTNEALSQGGYICDIKLSSGEVVTDNYLSISINFDSKEMNAQLNKELLSDERLREISFCFNNFD